MKIYKKQNSGPFAKAGVDFRDGDLLQILDAGREEEGTFGTQTVFSVRLPSGESKNLNFNQTSQNHLHDSLGDDSEQWKGKQVKAWVIKQNVSGTFRNVVYLTGVDQLLEGME